MFAINKFVIEHRLRVNFDAKKNMTKKEEFQCGEVCYNIVVGKLTTNLGLHLGKPLFIVARQLGFGRGYGCVDFTNLNKMCHKNSFDLSMDSTVGHTILSFIDAYFTPFYNQI